jgi:enoyl-[acyl-carrier-protein] reductase (NADH)
MPYVQVESHKHLYRDLDSGAILNTDIEELKAYYAQVEIKNKEMEEKLKLENKVNKLEDDIGEIKMLLHSLIEMRKPDGN